MSNSVLEIKDKCSNMADRGRNLTRVCSSTNAVLWQLTSSGDDGILVIVDRLRAVNILPLLERCTDGKK